MQPDRLQLIGNRLTLVGAIVYLLEWVAILATPVQAPSLVETKPDTIVALYTGHATGLAFSAVWFSLVLLGRIVFSAGLRDSFRRSGADTLLVDIGLAAMAASVILEIAGYALVAGAARLANTGGSQAAVVALDSAAGWLGVMPLAPLGGRSRFERIGDASSQAVSSVDRVARVGLWSGRGCVWPCRGPGT